MQLGVAAAELPLQLNKRKTGRRDSVEARCLIARLGGLKDIRARFLCKGSWFVGAELRATPRL